MYFVEWNDTLFIYASLCWSEIIIQVLNQNWENAIEFPCSFNKRNYLTISERIDELKKSISKCMRKVLILFVPHDILSIRKKPFENTNIGYDFPTVYHIILMNIFSTMSLKQDSLSCPCVQSLLVGCKSVKVFERWKYISSKFTILLGKFCLKDEMRKHHNTEVTWW